MGLKVLCYFLMRIYCYLTENYFYYFINLVFKTRTDILAHQVLLLHTLGKRLNMSI